jgi:hypothetical protein
MLEKGKIITFIISRMYLSVEAFHIIFEDVPDASEENTDFKYDEDGNHDNGRAAALLMLV